jgi:hypothetical protein
MFADVSEECATFIFRVETVEHVPDYTASQTRKE